ncbi:ComEC/Rec2 family competence protein [Lentzea sp. NPDC060358]|uniref:ComEC/Rec2 family competence protein n=1 Tax=Lentzea sp. NPDC060358 TaxID=3347103 RepID=UPI0036565744
MTDQLPLEVAILDVGHGNCAVIRDGARSVVVDIPRTPRVAAALVENGCDSVVHLLLSHADDDHIGGAARLISNDEVKVGTLWANPNAIQDSETYIDLLTVARDKFNRGEILFKSNLNVGANGDLDFDRVRIEIIHPDVFHAGIGPTRGRHRLGSISSNRMSAVLRVHLDGLPAALLPGDIDSKGFESIINRDVDISAPILVFPHHGGGANTRDERNFARALCEKVAPELVVFSLGRTRFKNPLPDIITGVREAVPGAHIACTQLSTRCHPGSDLSDEQEHLLASWPSSGKNGRSCCAGTVVAEWQDGGLLYRPTRAAHLPFISAKVSSPQCLANG